jgi:hypothetical protein
MTGACVGVVVGSWGVGTFVGFLVGLLVGCFGGFDVGAGVGAWVGAFVGLLVGHAVGCASDTSKPGAKSDCLPDGSKLGANEGGIEGIEVGASVHCGVQQSQVISPQSTVSCRNPRRQIFMGMSPEKLLLSNRADVKFVQRPISTGIVPLKLLLSMKNSSILLISPIWEGRGPERPFRLKSSVINSVNKVFSDGNWPTIKFELKSKELSLEDNKPSSGGICPSRLFLVRFTAVIRPLPRRRLPRRLPAHCTPNHVQTGSSVSQLAVFAHKPPFVL